MSELASPPLPSCSIVVRALNEAEHLPLLFDSLKGQRHQPDEVVLVDSGSTDGSVELARLEGFKVVHIAPSEFTFGRSLNVGCEAAKGEILIFLSAHVYALDDTWLDNLLKPFADPRVGLVYGRQTGDHRTSFPEMQLFASWFPTESDFDQQHPFCNNANCAIRRDIWEQMPYDEELPGLEDIAWATGMQNEGHKLVYAADAGVAHIHEESFRQTLNRYRREALAHRSLRQQKVFGATEAFRLAVRHIGYDSLAALRQRTPAAISQVILFRAAQFLGAYLGNRDSVDARDEVIARMYYPRR